MKRTIILTAALLSFCGCQHDIVRETDFNVTLDADNTYFEGEPVRFNFTGEVDNIVFYSGETGSQYKYKDRYTVPLEDVLAARLNMEFQARFGLPNALEIWVSKSFEGLNGKDGAADRATIKAMVDGDMQGWTRLDYEEGASETWTEQQFDLSEYTENFTIAFHWCPPAYDKTQRTYWLNGKLSIDLAGEESTIMDLSELAFTTVMMNEQIKDPYHKNAGNGSIILNQPNTGALIFQGVAGTEENGYCLDGWAISKPSPLNRVPNDNGTVIKNIQNYMHTYEYVWEKPGTYEVAFVGTNSDYLSATSETKIITVNIIDKF